RVRGQLPADARAGRFPDGAGDPEDDTVVAYRAGVVRVAVLAGRGRVDLLQRVPGGGAGRAVLNLAASPGPADELAPALPVAHRRGLDVHPRAGLGDSHPAVRRQPHVGVRAVLVHVVVTSVPCVI